MKTYTIYKENYCFRIMYGKNPTLYLHKFINSKVNETCVLIPIIPFKYKGNEDYFHKLIEKNLMYLEKENHFKL